jgi:hypothetical protein
MNYQERANRLLESYGLIEADMELCAKALTVGGGGLLPSGVRKYELAGLTSDVEGVIDFLSTLTVPATRIVLFSVSQHWTAAFDNHRGGGGGFVGFSLSRAQLLRSRSVRVVDQPGRVWRRGSLQVTQSYEARLVTVFDADGKDVKSIYCMDDDGRWDFASTGAKLDIETSFDYTAVKKKDRFTSENLRSLLTRLGIPVLTPSGFLQAGRFAMIKVPWKKYSACTFEQGEDPAFGYPPEAYF